MLVFRDDFFGEVTNEEAERIVWTSIQTYKEGQ